MRTAIVYHRVDWDGYTSAAVALKAFPKAELIGWNYGDNEPCVSEFDRVIVVDLSLSESWMLSNASKLIWIDHHKNVIESLQNNPVLAAVPGIRKDGIGACVLAWAYFLPAEDMPMHVRLVGTADVMDYEEQYALLSDALSYGLFLDTFGPGFNKETGLDVSKEHVKRAQDFIVSSVKNNMKIGQTLEASRAVHEKTLFKSAKYILFKQDGKMYNAAIVTIDGRPNACILSHLVAGKEDFYVCVSKDLNPNGRHKVSLRVSHNSDFDASKFCRVYGGNGHIKAAGCEMSKSAIRRLLFWSNCHKLSL